jgi:hypothetical protein
MVRESPEQAKRTAKPAPIRGGKTGSAAWFLPQKLPGPSTDPATDSQFVTGRPRAEAEGGFTRRCRLGAEDLAGNLSRLIERLLREG